MQPYPTTVEVRAYEVRAYSPSTREWTVIVTVLAASESLALGYARLKQLVPAAVTLVARPKPKR